MNNPVQDAERPAKAGDAEQGAHISRPGPVLEAVADAIDAARYAHPDHPRERPMPFAQAHRTDREYAFRLARAALKAVITDDMLRSVVRASVYDRIVGFSTPLNDERTKWGAPHYIRDVMLPRDKQELWRGDSHDEMMERCEIERMRLAISAAFRAAV